MSSNFVYKCDFSPLMMNASNIWQGFVEQDLASRRPKLRESNCDRNDNPRCMRSSSILYEIPPTMYWNALIPHNKAEQPISTNLIPIVDIKYGCYGPQEDKVLRHALKSETANIKSIAAQLNRSVNSIKQRMRKLSKVVQEADVESSESSGAVLERFLAVEEDSSVDIDAAIDAVDALDNTLPLDGPCYDGINDLCNLQSSGRGCTNAPTNSKDADLNSLQTLSDLSSAAIEMLSAVGAMVQSECFSQKTEQRLRQSGCPQGQQELTDLGESTLSDSGASTVAQEA